MGNCTNRMKVYGGKKWTCKRDVNRAKNPLRTSKGVLAQNRGSRAFCFSSLESLKTLAHRVAKVQVQILRTNNTT